MPRGERRRACHQERTMITTELRLPELGMVVGTRAMLGAGVALLLADRLSDDTRKGVGWALVAVGVLTTIPLAMLVFGSRKTSA
jgi:EamA domain-containing membrane protein RarD